MGKSGREGLSLGYRIMYRLRRAVMQMYGPAQLGDAEDPLAKLARERSDKVAAARAAREARDSQGK